MEFKGVSTDTLETLAGWYGVLQNEGQDFPTDVQVCMELVAELEYRVTPHEFDAGRWRGGCLVQWCRADRGDPIHKGL
jgi:hypothetical protein